MLRRSMPEQTFDLARLLSPVSPAAFFNDYYEQKPLLVRRNRADYYATLLTIDDVDRLITVLPPEKVVLANANAPVTLQAMARADASMSDASLDVVRACQLFDEGATFVLRDAHQRLASLASLCRTLESEVGAVFTVNLYMTPANGQGLDTHYDTHDTILVQAAGSKEWTIYGSPLRLPLIGQPFDKKETYDIGEPTMQLVLEAGDLLYIPRGYFHSGRSLNDSSLHATIGVWPYLWSNVLIEAMAELCLTDPDFRRSVPLRPGQPGFDIAAARRTFGDLMLRAAERAKVEPILDRMADEFVVSRPAMIPGQIHQMALARALAIDGMAGVRPTAIYRIVRGDGVIRIRAHGREIQLSDAADEAVTFALTTAHYRVAELPGGLEDEDKLMIVRRLIEEGLVRCVGNA
jgi:hypothetical protein